MTFHTCCFTGHRFIPAAVREELTAALDLRIAAVYDLGVREFRAGGALGFDTLAAQRVLAFRRTHPDCTLHLMLPCRDQHAKWRFGDRMTYQKLLSHADRVTVLQETYTAGCMHARNRALVEGSDICLAYLTSDEGGTAYTCSFARTHGVPVINVAGDLKYLA